MLYSGSLISGAFSGLIAAGITGNMDGAKGLRAWRWLFIIEGAITVVVACSSFFVLPNFPRTTTWLTEEERQLAVWRLEEDIGQDDWIDSKHQTFLHGLKLAFTDIKMYILVSLSIMLRRGTRLLLDYGNLIMLLLTQLQLDGYAFLHSRLRNGHKFLSNCCSNPRIRQYRIFTTNRTALRALCHYRLY
jgi:hypothetical protein